jgi:hypothetical protein
MCEVSKLVTVKASYSRVCGCVGRKSKTTRLEGIYMGLAEHRTFTLTHCADPDVATAAIEVREIESKASLYVMKRNEEETHSVA